MTTHEWQEVGTRIEMLRGKASKVEFAHCFGIHKNTLVRYEKGENIPDAAFLKNLMALKNVNPLWLLTGNGDIYLEGGPRDGERIQDPAAAYGGDVSGYATIPSCVLPDAGQEATDARQAGGDNYLQFSRWWLRNQLRAAEGDLLLIRVTGESMEPTLADGDLVLVDKRFQSEIRDGIYALRIDGILMVKRLQMLPAGVVKVFGDNRAYEPFEFALRDNSPQFAVVGKVVWAGKAL